MSFQKIVLVGNLSTDVELRYSPNGDPVASFGLATNERWNSQGEQKEQVTWWRVSVWGRQAEACNNYLSKGRLVAVECKMSPDRETGSPRVWSGSDGKPRASYEVKAQYVQFLGGGNGSQGNGNGAAETFDNNDVPF